MKYSDLDKLNELSCLMEQVQRLRTFMEHEDGVSFLDFAIDGESGKSENISDEVFLKSFKKFLADQRTSIIRRIAALGVEKVG